jgi:hypothetical protein
VVSRITDAIPTTIFQAAGVVKKVSASPIIVFGAHDIVLAKIAPGLDLD